MASEREIFSIAGPLHLTAVDWSNSHHRRSVAACLVQGVYILERDRQQSRVGPEARAPPWWDFFNFQLSQVLIDDVDNSMFGAIYELKSFVCSETHVTQNAPRYVIAFRGTINKSNSRSRDLKLDFQCILNKLHQTSRFELAMQEVQKKVAEIGASDLWLAGHSLGSAIALLAGKNMTRMSYPIETYLFNPPFLSIPIERIKNEKLKHGIRLAGSIVKAGLAFALKDASREDSQDENPFVVLSSWVPFLFVNPADHICADYIGYFEHRRKMIEIGAGKIGRLATQNSTGCLFSGALGKNSEPLHLLPCAHLTVNLATPPDFKRAHGIHQWWSPDFNGQSVLHQFS